MKQDRCVCLEDYRLLAQKTLPKEVFSYIDSGADLEKTKKNNHKAFQKLVMIPRVLLDGTNVNMGTTIFGK